MTRQTEFFKQYERRIRLMVHTFMPATVVRYYSDTKEADVELSFMQVDTDGTADKYPLIERAPVLKHVGPLTAGKTVFVAIAERALDNLQDKPFDPESSRMHDVRDAVVIGEWEGLQ